jgi:hypothetical protein
MSGVLTGPDEAFTIWAYLMYLLWSILVTVWVARTLHKNGRVFLVDAFQGHEALADSVNHLLVVGFYLVNIGFVALALKETHTPHSAQTALEFFSTKIGWVLLVLGAMHFFNMLVFSRMRRAGLVRRLPPPIPSRERVPQA